MIKELILQHFSGIRQHPSSNGWYTCKCPLCNDYKVRGGFKFENDGFGYNCFNCAAGIIYDPTSYTKFSDEAIELLDKIGVPETSYLEIEQHYLREFLQTGTTTKKQSSPIVLRSNLTTEPLTKPEWFIPLRVSTSSWGQVATAYLSHVRKVDPNVYDYHILDYDHPTVPVSEIKKWHMRIIIPIYYNGELVWWQGRGYHDSVTPKYLNSDTCGTNVLFSRIDKFYDQENDIVLIVEGFFDAIAIDGVACFRNKLTSEQLGFLINQQKRIVYIPDKMGNGHIGANQILNAGLEVSLPDLGNCKDVDEAVKKYGKFYVLASIMQNIFKGDEARYRLNMYCKK